MNELKIFEHPIFGEIRTLIIDGKMHFCALDVARALGYSNERNAIQRHCRHALKRGVGVHTSDKVDGTPVFQQIEMTFIPDGDVYRLTARSKLEGADKFESWIFDDIVPSVMQTGSYQISGNTSTVRVAPPTVPLGALVRLMEFNERQMLRRGCTAAEISAMSIGLMEAYGVPVTKAFSSGIDNQLCLFDTPAEFQALTA